MASNFSIWARLAFSAGVLACGLAVVTAPAAAATKDFSPGTVVESENASPDAAAKITITDYQVQIHLTCVAGSCVGHFATLTAKQLLRLQKVTCFATIPLGQSIFEAFLDYTSGPQSFYYDLVQRSSVNASGAHIYVFDQDGPFLVPKGKALAAHVAYTSGANSASAYCTVYGQRYTYP